jgi:hypothetical protein
LNWGLSAAAAGPPATIVAATAASSTRNERIAKLPFVFYGGLRKRLKHRRKARFLLASE